MTTRLEFGFSLVPTTDLGLHRELVDVAEPGGLDLVGVQDHPYVPALVDTFSLIGALVGQTERLRFFPDVAGLPLRPPAMLAKAGSTRTPPLPARPAHPRRRRHHRDRPRHRPPPLPTRHRLTNAGQQRHHSGRPAHRYV
ncbi:LLM class flavin-dependent oxidoreductase [Streptomyces sp. NPDC056831]|uniref:LLM class flavin-dependent oxidoreductase n=1 Tax=Streptomyces sp. NPDC056831 TaxID=3345954 RepID=UPI0036B607F0